MTKQILSFLMTLFTNLHIYKKKEFSIFGLLEVEKWYNWCMQNFVFSCELYVLTFILVMNDTI